MCVLFIFTDPNPAKDSYRLILASNRDEYYKRPAKPAFKCVDTQVVAGRDMEPGRENGSWLGVSWQQFNHIKYRIGALLNVTGATKQCAKGRGFIVIDYLACTKSIDDYQCELHADDDNYNDYKFVSIDLGAEVHISHTTNVLEEDDTRYEGKQFLAFGNSTVGQPLQKVLGGKRLFEDIVAKFNAKEFESKLEEQLIELLKLTKRFLPDEELQRRSPIFFEDLSSIYVQLQNGSYGTRTHTVILVDYDWQLHFKEVTMSEPINANEPCWLETNLCITNTSS